MTIINVLAGTAVLVFGRKLFWLFVGCIGFVAGIDIATRFFSGQPDWMVLMIAIAAGLVGALLAIFLQRLAIAVVGFSAGGYLVMYLVNIFGWDPGHLFWVPFIAGGLAGALLLYFLFDWTLIFFSSITGAHLITQSIHLGPLITGFLFMGLFILGFMVQATLMKRQ